MHLRSSSIFFFHCSNDFSGPFISHRTAVSPTTSVTWRLKSFHSFLFFRKALYIDSQQKGRLAPWIHPLTLTLFAMKSATSAASRMGGNMPVVFFTTVSIGIAMSFPAARNALIFFFVKMGVFPSRRLVEEAGLCNKTSVRGGVKMCASLSRRLVEAEVGLCRKASVRGGVKMCASLSWRLEVAGLCSKFPVQSGVGMCTISSRGVVDANYKAGLCSKVSISTRRSHRPVKTFIWIAALGPTAFGTN